jgi:WD40 repeat protein
MYVWVTETPCRFIDSKRLPFAALKLAWSSSSSIIFTFGADSFIQPLKVDLMRPELILKVDLLPKLTTHTDLIKDVIAVEEYDVMCSTGLDGRVCIWDTVELSLLSTRTGHKGGVRVLTYIGEGIVLSGGYDYDILAWDISGAGTEELFGLRSGFGGHQGSVEVMCKIPGREQIISIDSTGTLKRWNTRNMPDILDSDRILQSFSTVELTSGLPPAHLFSATMLPSATLIAAGHKLHIFDCINLKPVEVAPKHILFNAAYMSFMMTVENGVRYFSAVDGKPLMWMKGLFTHEISSFCFDERLRKYIVGTSSGEVQVVNCHNGAVMKRLESHNREVSAVLYNNEDDCIITVSWDRSLHVYDDHDKHGALLRCALGVSASDISCAAFSHDLSLIAIGSGDGMISFWDFQFIRQDLPKTKRVHKSEITAMAFIDTLPLMLSADSNGLLVLWPVRPISKRNTPLLKWMHQKEHTMAATPPGISSVDVVSLRDDDAADVGGAKKMKHLAYVADTAGMITIYDLTEVVRLTGVSKVPSNHIIPGKVTYNPRRRICRDLRSISCATVISKEDKAEEGKTASLGGRGNNASNSNGLTEPTTVPNTDPEISLDFSMELNNVELTEENISIVKRWRGHTGNINSIKYISSDYIPGAVVTCGEDKKACVWDYMSGVSRGILTRGRLDDIEPITEQWSLNVDTAGIETGRMARVRNVKREMDNKNRHASIAQAKLHVKSEKSEKSEKNTKLSTNNKMVVDDTHSEKGDIRKVSLKSNSSKPKGKRAKGKRKKSKVISQDDNIAHAAMWRRKQMKEMAIRASETMYRSNDDYLQRGKLFSQSFGQETWNKSIAEKVHDKLVAMAKKKQRLLERKEKIAKRRKMAKVVKEAREAAKYEELLDTNIAPKAASSLPQLTAKHVEDPAAEDNWTIGSVNRQRLMYSHFYEEKHRIETKREKRLGKSRDVTWRPSDELLSVVGILNWRNKSIMNEVICRLDAEKEAENLKRIHDEKEAEANYNKSKSKVKIVDKHSKVPFSDSSASASAPLQLSKSLPTSIAKQIVGSPKSSGPTLLSPLTGSNSATKLQPVVNRRKLIATSLQQITKMKSPGGSSTSVTSHQLANVMAQAVASGNTLMRGPVSSQLQSILHEPEAVDDSDVVKLPRHTHTKEERRADRTTDDYYQYTQSLEPPPKEQYLGPPPPLEDILLRRVTPAKKTIVLKEVEKINRKEKLAELENARWTKMARLKRELRVMMNAAEVYAHNHALKQAEEMSEMAKMVVQAVNALAVMTYDDRNTAQVKSLERFKHLQEVKTKSRFGKVTLDQARIMREAYQKLDKDSNGLVNIDKLHDDHHLCDSSPNIRLQISLMQASLRKIDESNNKIGAKQLLKGLFPGNTPEDERDILLYVTAPDHEYNASEPPVLPVPPEIQTTLDTLFRWADKRQRGVVSYQCIREAIGATLLESSGAGGEKAEGTRRSTNAKLQLMDSMGFADEGGMLDGDSFRGLMCTLYGF